MAVKTVADLFIHELSDTYSAEKQMTRSLPKMARASSDPQLAQAFLDHLQETRGQVERIDEVVELLNLKLKRIKCAAMEGLVEEGKDLIDEIDKGPVLDVALRAANKTVSSPDRCSALTRYGKKQKQGNQRGPVQEAGAAAACSEAIGQRWQTSPVR